ncbi:leucine-rich repeat-containing protein 72 isoform X1 [Chiroxiphia lanceolata]|uniref:leucine-rich repeat-containing protein 72 isoform X1 n=1 Tax=Chiroxiphia lanceolata TaxID=296741 RepID=UPI0013CEC685|nr:leucine-rich repeat-containing protein 72 isoform X1 [Chiroxiphia lanceolata]
MRSHVKQYAKYKSLGTAFLTCRTQNPGSVLSGAVENQLKICGFKSNGDVIGLYLARQGLRSIPSLSQFNRLKYLWLNNNKIQDLNFLIKNYCLTELYLNNNELTDISGALKHLCSLQILFLHNNELKKLGKTVKELKGMISLHTLNLFQNPLAYDPDYRLYIIYILPSVQLLDRKLVTQRERESAFHLYNPERSLLVQSIAFGKRVKTPLGTPVGSRRCIHPARSLIMPSERVASFSVKEKKPGNVCLWGIRELHKLKKILTSCEFGDNTNKVPFENPEDAVLVRAMTRSLTEFSSVDWNKVATCQERRLQNKAEEPLEKLTVQFR